MKKKGINAELELFHLLRRKGFFVVRAAGSGHMKTPDLLAFKAGCYLGFEVKAHKKDILTIPSSQIKNLKEWEKNTGITIYIAWKTKKFGFLFIPTNYFDINGKKTKSIDIETAIKLAYKEWEIN